MKPLPRHRRRAAALGALAAIVAASSSLMVATHGRGAGVDAAQFGLGLAVGLSAVLLAAAFVKLRMR